VNNLKRMLEAKAVELLDLATPSYLPGHLLKIHYFWRPGDFGAEVRLDEDRGLATQILGVPALSLSPRVPSDIVVQNVRDQFQISAGVGGRNDLLRYSRRADLLLGQTSIFLSNDFRNGSHKRQYRRKSSIRECRSYRWWQPFHELVQR